ncbi:hypothetical protein BaRGS_00026491 [Batillaria attramentaria]|uniref:Uncharacterized protein n=1 Tax=Batillaria attramentaria TaxID=370345 RepID=A0ABD0K5V7_9CAEN
MQPRRSPPTRVDKIKYSSCAVGRYQEAGVECPSSMQNGDLRDCCSREKERKKCGSPESEGRHWKRVPFLSKKRWREKKTQKTCNGRRFCCCNFHLPHVGQRQMPGVSV